MKKLKVFFFPLMCFLLVAGLFFVQAPVSEILRSTIDIGFASEVHAGILEYDVVVPVGIADADVYVQGALNRVPVEGSQLRLWDISVAADGTWLHSEYNWTALATVTRAIGNVTIIGMGASTVINSDGVTPIFQAGGNGWLFKNMSFPGNPNAIDKNGYDAMVCECWVNGVWVNDCGGNVTAGNGTTELVFKTIDVPAGTNPVADSYTDTLYLLNPDGLINITGNSTADSVDFTLSGNVTLDIEWDTINEIETITGVNILIDTEVDSEAELEALLLDVANVFTNNDGALADDDLSDNSITDLNDVTIVAAVNGEILIYDTGQWKNGNTTDGMIPASITRDAEWDTIGEIEAATSVNIIVSTEIDTIAELETLLGSINLITSTEIDSIAELEALVGVTFVTTSTVLAGDVTGNVTATVVGDDSHNHTGTTISGLDISSDTNLAATSPITLTDDTVGINLSTFLLKSDSLAGDVTGNSSTTVVGDDSHAHTGSTISGLDISSDTNLTATAPVVLTGDDLGLSGTMAQFDTSVSDGNPLWESDFNAKGDLLTATANDTPANLSVGGNGTLLIGNTSSTVGMSWSDTLLGNLNFNNFKAIAMVCDNGATAPASPVKGQWFLHTPTGRSVLMQYGDTQWRPIASIGSMTMYIDTGTGSDAIDKGGATTTNAFATLQYAIDLIPPIYAGDIIIYLTAETYSETVTIQGKNPTGAYTITVQGTRTVLDDSLVCADGSLQGAFITLTTRQYAKIIRNAGTWTTGPHQRDKKWIRMTSGAAYSGNPDIDSKMIDGSNSNATSLRPLGLFTNGAPTTGDTFNVEGPGTIVTKIKIGSGQKNVIINDIDFNLANGTHSDIAGFGAEVRFNRCSFDFTAASSIWIPQGAKVIIHCCYTTKVRLFVRGGSKTWIGSSYLYINLNIAGIQIDDGGSAYLGDGTIIDGVDTVGNNKAVYGRGISTLNCNGDVLSTIGSTFPPTIRNCGVVGVDLSLNAIASSANYQFVFWGDDLMPNALEATTSTSAGHLMDTTVDFTTIGIAVGDKVQNLTQTKAALVTNVAATDLTLDADIMISGNNYRIVDAASLNAIDVRWEVGDVQVDYLTLKETALTVTSATGYGRIYIDSVAHDLWYITNGGTAERISGQTQFAKAYAKLDLSGAAQVDVPIFHTSRACTLVKALLVYTEASSADAGVTVTIGKEDTAAYYYTGTSQTSQALWYELDVTLLQTAIAAGDTVVCGHAGTKTGTGEILVCIEYYVN